MKKNNFYAVLATILLIVACKRDFSEKLRTEDSDPGTISRAVTNIQIRPLPLVLTEEATETGMIPGDHTQHMLGIGYCASAPNRIYMAQDVSNVWVSKNAGKNWFNLLNKGLGTNFMVSVEVDPYDPNRVFVAAQCRQYNKVDAGNQGIYLSTDGGVNWTRKAVRSKIGEIRSSNHLIAYAPSTSTKGQPGKTWWYAAFGERNAKDDYTADDGLLVSTTGGIDWTEVRKLPRDPFGAQIRGIRVHPTNPNIVYIYGENGLFRIRNATTANGEVTKLLAGNIFGELYLSDNGTTMIVAVEGEGIYKNTNSGNGQWTVLKNDSDVRYCYVNKKYPKYIFAVPKAAQISISSNGGSSWHKPAEVDYRLGYTGTWNTNLGGEFAYVLPDPRDSNKVFMHTKSKNFRSDNAGKKWYRSDNCYNGVSHIAAEQMFDPKDQQGDKFVYFSTDRGVWATTNGGKSFFGHTFTKPEQQEYGLGWQSALSGAVRPGTDTIIACIGESGGPGQMFVSSDFGKNWALASTSGNKSRPVVAYNLQNSNYCYQWRERSTDGGKTWNLMNGFPDNSVICGVAPSNGKVIYAIDKDGTKRSIYRSKNGGDSWNTTPVLTATYPLTTQFGSGDKNQFVFCVAPNNANIVYTNSATGHITKWNLSGATPVATQIIFPTRGGVDNNKFFIEHFAIDPRHPEIMYATNVQANTGFKFFRYNSNTGVMDNLSNYIPQGSIKGLAVSPVTGEVFISGENGSMVMMPPYNTTKGTFTWVPNMNFITSAYN